MLRCLVGLLFLLAATTIHADERPNFIIMIADDVAWNDIGAYGHPKIRTPNLDQLAKDGERFDLAFLTCSSCSPSRCSIMTGRYPHSTGAAELHQPLPANQVMFPALLQQAGYYTAAAGKWHLGNPAKKAFDRIEGGGPSGCENWVKVLAERPRDQPFFLWLAAFDAHRGYSRNAIPQPHSGEDAVVPPYLPDVPATRDDLAMYYDEISRLDRFAGEVLAELDKQKIAENTMVLFLSDNGRPFPRCKTTVYDSGVRTPFIVRWPAVVQPGAVCKELVSSVDIAPTLCELAGLKPTPSFQGVSFVPQLPTPKAVIRNYVAAEHNWHDYEAHERSVRDKQFLYIQNWRPQLPGTPPADAVRSPTYSAMKELRDAGKLSADQKGCFITPRPEEELYDTAADPHCLQNLAGEVAHQDTLRAMQKRMKQHREQFADADPGKLTPDKFDREKGTPLR